MKRVVVFSLAVAIGLAALVVTTRGDTKGKSPNPPAKEIVKKILEVKVAVAESQPTILVVSAVGEVPTAGYKNVELVRVVYSKPPADGIQDYVLFAQPPAGPAAQVISKVAASNSWKAQEREGPWLKGVRVHGVGTGVIQQLPAGTEAAPKSSQGLRADTTTEQELRAQGEKEAEQDIAKGALGLRPVGLPTPWDDAYTKLLWNTLGVRASRVAGDLITDENRHIFFKALGYNARMGREIAARFGDKALESLLKEAQQGAGWATLVKGNNEFALDLYARLRQKEGNLFCSPYSITTALAMTYAGARGETAEQMAKVLHFGLDQSLLHPAFAELTRELNGHGLPRDYQLSVANSLWGDGLIHFLPDYQQLTKANYGSRIRPVDFRGNPDQARGLINRWVEQRTNDKIKNLLHPGDITDLTSLVLVNAIYFKAAWQSPFEPSATNRKDTFQVAEGKTVPVEMMRQTGHFRYLDGDGFQTLELPYEGQELSMVILLPKDKNGMAKFEQSLTAAKLSGWLARLKPRQVAVQLPRFKVTSRFELKEVLSEMGMPLAFQPGRADFTAITKQQKLSISKVIHQAFVDVNEEGTEAAAATAVVMRLPIAVQPEKPVVFRADHPFLFLLRDTRTGSILFMGRLSEPQAK